MRKRGDTRHNAFPRRPSDLGYLGIGFGFGFEFQMTYLKATSLAEWSSYLRDVLLIIYSSGIGGRDAVICEANSQRAVAISIRFDTYVL